MTWIAQEVGRKLPPSLTYLVQYNSELTMLIQSGVMYLSDMRDRFRRSGCVGMRGCVDSQSVGRA